MIKYIDFSIFLSLNFNYFKIIYNQYADNQIFMKN
jgi:hypothetical protein